MVKVSGVTKQVGTFALKDISFDVPAGYICGLAGRNGAGKTTLLHLLLGLYKPDGGEIVIDSMSYPEREKDIHDMLGAVLVEELFDGRYSIRENANYYGSFFSKYGWEKMEGYLDTFQLEPEKKFSRLSKGEKLKCQFAFALAHEPKLLILDEPTANFDLDFREQFFEILQRFIADGTKSVVFATHLTEDLDRLADYFVYLEEGRQMFAGDMEQFRKGWRIVSGETYKIRLLPKERILSMEEGRYGTKALIRHSRHNHYDAALQVTYPSVEEFMYFFSKRNKEASC